MDLQLIVVGSTNERRRKKEELDFLPCMINTIHVAKCMSFGQSKIVGVSSDALPLPFCIEEKT